MQLIGGSEYALLPGCLREAIIVDPTISAFKYNNKMLIFKGELEEQLNSDINKFMQEIDNYNVKNKHLFDRLISSISKCISETFSEAPVDVYGSFATELCLPQSDIDLVVRI